MNRMALAGAALLAVLAAFLLQKGLSRDLEAKAALEEPIEVVTAERDILPGMPLGREDIQPMAIPRKALAPSTVTAEHGTTLLGQALVRPRRKGEQLSWFDVAEHGRGLASAVPPGERAVTLGVNDRSGLSGMLKPNDRVDVLYLSTLPAPREGGADRSAARVLLPNVTVLAVGTRTGLDSAPVEEAAYGTVTLACAPEEAAALALAQSRGELVLVLRNPEDHAATAPVVLEEDLASGGELARRRQERLEIYRRGVKE